MAAKLMGPALELLFSRRRLLDNLDDFSGVLRFFEFEHKVLGLDGIALFVEGDRSGDSFEIF